MYCNEAPSEPEPRASKRRSIRKTIRYYFLAICTLFIITMLLCMNNMIVYKSYRDIRQQFQNSIQNSKVVQVDINGLETYNETLVKENSVLREKNEELKDISEDIKMRLLELEKQNEELSKKNKELLEDNIALQNSLKSAAAAGIKPQNYTHFEGVSSRGELDRGSYVGKFTGTAYTPSKEECGNNKGITNSGKPIIPGISVAVDPKHWPYGTVFYIKGLGYAVAMDSGSAIKGKYRFDFAVFDKKFAKSLGQKQWEVYLVKKGDGKVGDVKF